MDPRPRLDGLFGDYVSPEGREVPRPFRRCLKEYPYRFFSALSCTLALAAARLPRTNWSHTAPASPITATVQPELTRSRLGPAPVHWTPLL